MKKIFSIFLITQIVYGASAQSDTNYLPVRLSAFEIGVQKNIATLHWSTVCYLNYANFEIQVSADGAHFKTIHSFVADKYRCAKPFDFTDSSLTYFGNIFYRINVGNIDGKIFASEIRSVYLREKSFDLVRVFPTIATASLNFSLSNDQAESFTAAIINSSGTIVTKKQLQSAKGISRFAMRTDNLPSGSYWLHVFNRSGDAKTVQFIK